MGDAVFLIVVAWLGKALTGSDAATGVVVFLAAAPFLLFGPFAGALADRVDRRRLMIASDLARAAILLPLPFVAPAVGSSFALVAVAAFLLAAASTPFLPARDALLPRLAEGRPLLRINAAFQTSGQVATIAGLVLGGTLLVGARDDPAALYRVLALDGATFLASAVTLAFVAVPPGPRGAAPRRSLASEAKEGLSDAARDPLLRAILVLTALDNAAIMGPAIVGAALFVRDDLGLTAGHLAWFEAAMAGGFLAGALLVARVASRLATGPLILLGMVLDGLTYVPFAWVRSWPLALVLIAFHGLFIPWIVVGRTTLLQRHVPESRAGRTFALVNLTVAGMTALSALLAGAIAQAFGARALFLVAGVFGAACGLYGFLFLPRLRAAR
jgi:MFS family permease